MRAGWIISGVISGLFAVLVVWPGAGQAQEPGNASVNALVFKHPTDGYQLMVPPGVQLEDRGSERGIALTSRKGYLLTIQTGKSRRDTPTHALLARLESRYLGSGRPWSVKIDEKAATIAGLEALESTYEGAGSRIRVVVVRGKTLDYVFFFFASLTEFINLEVDFNWVLSNFQPTAADVVANNTGSLQKFDGSTLGYMIDYPATWVFERPGQTAVKFSGKPGTPEYFVTVDIQNIKGNKAATLTDRLKRDIVGIDGAAVFADEGAFDYIKDGQSFQGLQFSVTYSRDGTQYRQWTVAIPRTGGDIIHLWSYAAPTDRFARFAPTAGKMLGTWTITR